MSWMIRTKLVCISYETSTRAKVWGKFSLSNTRVTYQVTLVYDVLGNPEGRMSSFLAMIFRSPSHNFKWSLAKNDKKCCKGGGRGYNNVRRCWWASPIAPCSIRSLGFHLLSFTSTIVQLTSRIMDKLSLLSMPMLWEMIFHIPPLCLHEHLLFQHTT